MYKIKIVFFALNFIKFILINHIFKNSYSINIKVVKETRIKWNLNWYLVWTQNYTRIS